MKYYAVLPLLAAAASAQTTWTVTVGGVQAQPTGAPTPVLGYSPEAITANKGDTVEFVFLQKNHTATQSTFAEPCVPMPGGKNSGFMPNLAGAPNVTWSMTVDTTDPIWMFCEQDGHCGSGMVFSINAATAGNKTFTDYKQLAIKINGTDLATAGIVNPNPQAAAQPSTVVVAATPGNGALSSQATVVAGQGTTPDGQACDCSCLCGTNSFPQNAAMGNFGGFAGMIGS